MTPGKTWWLLKIHPGLPVFGGSSIQFKTVFFKKKNGQLEYS